MKVSMETRLGVLCGGAEDTAGTPGACAPGVPSIQAALYVRTEDAGLLPLQRAKNKREQVFQFKGLL